MPPPSLWLRCETKPFEKRAALTPTTSKRLLGAGFKIYVERDTQRIFSDSEYEAVGCEMVANNSWPEAPLDATIVGLKELEEADDPLPHTHLYFGHCYKQQAGWTSLLSRFRRGHGTLYDLEFLTHPNGRRVAAFGYYAGFTGAAVGALALGMQIGGRALGPIQPFQNEDELVETVQEHLYGKEKVLRALVIGALGRCGGGAVDMLRKIGFLEHNIIKWDLQETARGGPFPEILDVHLFINCIHLNTKIPPFIDHEQIINAGRRRNLSVIVDVSCDTTNPFNPIPIYDINTTLSSPTVYVEVGPGNPALSVVSIDHLPTLLPREASEQFSADLLPSLLEYPESRVWDDAMTIFKEKLTEMDKEDVT